MSGFLRKTVLLSAATGLALLAGDWAYAQDAGGGEEIIVTARRRAENIQRVPVTVNALTSEGLREAGVKNFTDLNQHIPGINFVASGGFLNTVFSIRGVSRSVIGNVQPAVGTYVNEVPLSYWGANIPTYDVSSVQVLKGPQGTLFGRNTTAGAILVTTNQPTYDFGGSIEGTFGKYNWHQLTGAVNIPIVDQKVALRLAGQWARRDGFTKNLSFPGHDPDDIHRDQGRASLLIEPFEGFKNVTVYDWLVADQVGGNNTPYTFGGAATQFGFLGSLLSYDVPARFAAHQAAGVHSVYTNIDLLEKARTTLLTNTTTWELGGVTLKNIYGLRKVHSIQTTSVDGLDVPAVDAETVINHKQWSEEFQASGKALNDRLDWVAGVFYLDFRPYGPQRLAIQQFGAVGAPFAPFPPDFVTAVPIPGTSKALVPGAGGLGTSEFFYDQTRAAYGQIGYDFGGLWDKLDGLKLDLGYRYTEDKEKSCAVPNQLAALPPITPEQCDATHLIASSKSYASTYTIGLDYQLNDDVLLYAVTRRGYRAGGQNNPVFGGTLKPFQSYKPEYVQDVELGAKTNWRLNSWSGKFNIAAYSAWYQRLIVGITTGNDPDPDGDGLSSNNPANTTFFANIGKARVSGIEIDGAVSPLENLEITYSATWIDKNITDLQVAFPNTLVSAAALQTPEGVSHSAFLGGPKYTYSAGVRYVLPLPDTMGQVVFNANHWITSSEGFASVRTKPWNKTDFRLDWNGIYGSPIDAGLFVTNAFDTTGVLAASLSSEGLGYNAVIYAEPRVFGGTIRYHFGAE